MIIQTEILYFNADHNMLEENFLIVVLITRIHFINVIHKHERLVTSFPREAKNFNKNITFFNTFLLHHESQHLIQGHWKSNFLNKYTSKRPYASDLLFLTFCYFEIQKYVGVVFISINVLMSLKIHLFHQIQEQDGLNHLISETFVHEIALMLEGSILNIPKSLYV